MNERLEDYSTLTFEAGEPGFDFLRYAGARVLGVLGDDQTNRWVMDQVMDIDGPDVVRQLAKSMSNLHTDKTEGAKTSSI